MTALSSIDSVVNVDRSASTERKVPGIPFFNYRDVFRAQEAEYVEIFRDVLRRGAFIQQRDLETFERNLATFLGVRHAIGVANATDGLVISWRAAGLRVGDEVIVPSHTMVATAAAVHFAGGTPVLVDCGFDHLIDAAAVEAAITPRTRSLCPVHLNGRTAAMDALLGIADRHGLLVVEDAAQALGSKYRDRAAGTFGQAGVFSFYPAKLLGCMGDGGAVVTNDDDMAAQIMLLRDHGRQASGDIGRWGLNSRLDNLQAALLDYQLRHYDSAIRRRRELASRYALRLSGIPEIVLPPPPDADPFHFDVYQNYEIEAVDRDRLREYLRASGVETLVQWGGKPVHQHSALGLNAACPATDRLFARCLMLPMNIMVTDEQVDLISALIARFYGR